MKIQELTISALLIIFSACTKEENKPQISSPTLVNVRYEIISESNFIPAQSNIVFTSNAGVEIPTFLNYQLGWTTAIDIQPKADTSVKLKGLVPVQKAGSAVLAAIYINNEKKAASALLANKDGVINIDLEYTF